MGKISTLSLTFDFSKAAKRALTYAVAFTGRNDYIQIVLAHISGHGNFKLLPENFTKLEKKYIFLFGKERVGTDSIGQAKIIF